MLGWIAGSRFLTHRLDSGLLPRDMSDRVIYCQERQLTSQVNAIEHIESQSLSGYGVVKIFSRRASTSGPRSPR
jgi:hypothetical protein